MHGPWPLPCVARYSHQAKKHNVNLEVVFLRRIVPPGMQWACSCLWGMADCQTLVEKPRCSTVLIYRGIWVKREDKLPNCSKFHVFVLVKRDGQGNTVQTTREGDDPQQRPASADESQGTNQQTHENNKKKRQKRTRRVHVRKVTRWRSEGFTPRSTERSQSNGARARHKPPHRVFPAPWRWRAAPVPLWADRPPSGPGSKAKWFLNSSKKGAR